MQSYSKKLFHPISLLAFVILVAVMASSTNLGTDGITYVVVIAAVMMLAGVALLSYVWRALKDMINGKPNLLDHMASPGGYRRARQAETDEEQARYSRVRPTPNRPLTVDADATEVLQPQAIVTATPTQVMHYSSSQDRKLRLADACNPRVDLVIGRAVIFFGLRGSGKTNALARFLEQVFRFPIPALVCDYEEDYISFPEVLERCIIAGAANWPGQHRLRRYWKVNAKAAEAFGYAILEYGVQVVLQIGTFETLEEAAQVMTGAIRGMFRWAEEQAPDARVPALICLDEAQHFLPQNSSVSNIKDEQARELLKAFMDVNARGRKRGLTPIIATQRPAQIRKEVITGSEIYFLLKQTNARDLDAYEELLGRGAFDRRSVASFEQGESLVYESGESWKIRFHQRESEHRGKTPTLTQALQRYRGGEPAPSQFDFAGDSDAWRDAPDESAEDQDDMQDREEQEPRHFGSQRSVPPVKTREERMYDKILAAYLAGKTTQMAIANALEIGVWEVRKHWDALNAEIERREAAQELQLQGQE